MKIKDLYNLYIKGRSKDYDMRDINNKLPKNDIIAKDVLKYLNNSKTEIKEDNDIKGNYYVFLNDTIYLTNKGKSSKEYSRLTVICHESIHSVQSKILQMINFVLSNVEIISFIVCLILKLIFKIEKYIDMIYIICAIISIIPRLILEIHASLGSINLTKKYFTIINKNLKISKEEVDFYIKVIRFQIYSLLPFMLASLFFWKIIRITVILIL